MCVWWQCARCMLACFDHAIPHAASGVEGQARSQQSGQLHAACRGTIYIIYIFPLISQNDTCSRHGVTSCSSSRHGLAAAVINCATKQLQMFESIPCTPTLFPLISVSKDYNGNCGRETENETSHVALYPFSSCPPSSLLSRPLPSSFLALTITLPRSTAPEV